MTSIIGSLFSITPIKKKKKKLGVRFGGLVSPSFRISYLLREGGDQVRWRFQMSFSSHGRHLGLKAPQTSQWHEE